MDTSGFDQVGRYGTLSLLKAGKVSPDQSIVVTSFGVDTAPLTFGSATSCDVRLYYPDVEKLHCKIVFNEENKAFLTIIGASGVSIDGCKIYPHTSSESSVGTSAQDSAQSIIPLTNHSVFEIHGKRFRFSYPPKEVRKAILDTPPQQKRRALRLSMIQSAEVFSPRPSADPRENLRILQSPLKPAFMKSPSKLRSQALGSPIPSPRFQDDDDDDDDDEEEDIVLVETNHPQVVEEDKDLIILENAPLPAPRVQSPAQPPVTPRRRSLASNALHRAVLIRSAQRAVIRAERVREEEEDLEEEAEVFGTVLEEDEEIIGDDEGLEEDDEIHDVHMRSPEEDNGNASEDESTESEEEEQQPPTDQQKSLWRKSMERMWPFRSASPERPSDSSAGGKAPDVKEESDSEGEDDTAMQTDDAAKSLPNRNIPSTPIRRALGSFMTPQHPAAQPPNQRIFPSVGGSQSSAAGPAPGRFSLGGGEARRVIVQKPWKVKDLVVPEPAPAPASPIRPQLPPAQTSPVRATPKLTLEEKKAIQERRRSAVKQPDNFFAGGIPGMSPNKASSLAAPASNGSTWRASTSPTKPNFGSPTKGRPLETAISEQEESESPKPQPDNADSDEDPLDTHILMERMKSTVEDIKRRRSMAAGGSTPQFPPPSFHPQTDIRPEVPATRVTMASRLSVGGGVPDLGPIKKLDFSTVSATPVRKTYEPAPSTPKPILSTLRAPSPTTMDVDTDDKSDNVGSSPQAELPAFSLLRPAGREEAESRRSSGGGQITPTKFQEEDISEEEVPSAKAIPLPELVVNDEPDVQMESEHEDEVEEPVVKVPSPKKTRSRLIRPGKEKEVVAQPEEVEEPAQPVRKPPSRSRSKPPSTAALAVPATRTRSKSPQPPQEEEPAVDETPVQRSTTRAKSASKTKTPATARRGRKAAATPDLEVPETDDELQTPMTAAARRGRSKPRVEAPETVEEQPEEEAEPEAAEEPVAPKRGRPKKPTPAETKSKIPAAKATTSRSRVRQVRQEEAEEDPLDSYDVNGEADEPPKAPVAAPAARSRVTKIPAVASRARTTKKVVKQEEDAQPAPVPAKTSRTTRVNAAATPATTATASKVRKLRTPATAPAATTVVDKGKENIAGGSGTDTAGEPEEGVTKVRVSRTRGAATAKKVTPKAEEVTAEIPVAPAKTTRAKATATSRTTARTRTKTG